MEIEHGTHNIRKAKENGKKIERFFKKSEKILWERMGTIEKHTKGCGRMGNVWKVKNSSKV